MEAWLAEDIGRGDLTAAALQGQQGQAHWVAKQPGRFCGGPLVQRLFQRLDPGVSLRLLRQDGDAVEAGDCQSKPFQTSAEPIFRCRSAKTPDPAPLR